MKVENGGEKRQEEMSCQACIWFERYEIKEILGTGSTGRVYLAKDIRLGRFVAIKILEQVTEQFQEEIGVLKRQALWMLPAVYDAWEEENRTGVIVMEYVEGRNLKEYLTLHRQISERQIYEWGLQLGAFLMKLHGENPKILYRDLKTENIIVQPDKTLRLVDVGAAVRLERAEGCRHKRVGTRGYAAPEQWEGKVADERADIYGLGAVLYAVTEGEEKLRNVVVSKNIAEHGAGPVGMMRVIRRCLQREPEKRYATAEAFLEDWKRYKRVGKWSAFLISAENILRHGFLYAAVYVVWYRQEFLPLVWNFLAGYLLMKGAEYVCRKRNKKWEQKKSVWCREAGCDTV